MSSRAVFLDRDGVINEDTHLVTQQNQMKIFPFVGDTIAHFCSRGFRVVVVTNQPAIARGLMTESSLANLHAYMNREIQTQNPAAVIDRIYFCPHHPNADLPAYRSHCRCRKPHPGMLLQASKELDLDLSQSFMIGDRITDMVAGQLAGCTNILIESGQHKSPPIQTDLAFDPGTVPIRHRVPSLQETREWI